LLGECIHCKSLSNLTACKFPTTPKVDHERTLIYWVIQLFGFITFNQSFDYSLNPSLSKLRLELIDEVTGISNIRSLFIGEVTNVMVQGISWIPNAHKRNGSHDIKWTMYVDGIIIANGNMSLIGIRRKLPALDPVGSFDVDRRGIHNVTV
jgi:hypothetical protein